MTLDISIHALREEGDPSSERFPVPPWNFYPRPPRGGRPPAPRFQNTRKRISIHALREEGDGPSPTRCWMLSSFLSTPSARRATAQLDKIEDLEANFYPRPPRGGRLVTSSLCLYYTTFLSTPSARRATSCGVPVPDPLLHFYPRPPRGGRLPASAKGG